MISPDLFFTEEVIAHCVRHITLCTPVPVDAPASGPYRLIAADLEAFLVDSFAGLGNEGYAARLRQIVAEAQHDEHVARVLADFTAVRRAALRCARYSSAAGSRGPARRLGGWA